MEKKGPETWRREGQEQRLSPLCKRYRDALECVLEARRLISIGHLQTACGTRDKQMLLLFKEGKIATAN